MWCDPFEGIRSEHDPIGFGMILFTGEKKKKIQNKIKVGSSVQRGRPDLVKNKEKGFINCKGRKRWVYMGRRRRVT